MDGEVGLAWRVAGYWELADRLINADGLNNELERPHMIYHDGRYYCFWSTQRKVFAAGGPSGATGLYGMVAYAMNAPWRPLNVSGLFKANPAAGPIHACSWLVLDDLSVISFVDCPGLTAEPADALVARRHFGGTPAMPLKLKLDGDQATLA